MCIRDRYPYDTYSVIASDFYIGGMEYPTLVMIDQSLYNEKDKFLLEYVIAHETAHQWWYSVCLLYTSSKVFENRKIEVNYNEDSCSCRLSMGR